MEITASIGGTLQEHVLENGVLPLAPRRPFAERTTKSLAAAADLSLRFPEKCGILSHIVRSHLKNDSALPRHGVTIEAHFDSVAVTDDLADRLLRLGFEPDGFAQFVPAHFADHFTLKFKIDADATTRIRQLRAEVDDRCEQLIQELSTNWENLDCYLEVEIYSDETRHRWSSPTLEADWEAHLPFGPREFISVVPPRDDVEARRTGIPTTLVKRADIHLKVAPQTPTIAREKLVERLEEVGFYRVLTWAGNHICTAQFARGVDAQFCFQTMANYLDRYGGCSELTLEPVARVWRSRRLIDGHEVLGSLPPLVTSLRSSARSQFKSAAR